jgi:hypothetical protein
MTEGGTWGYSGMFSRLCHAKSSAMRGRPMRSAISAHGMSYELATQSDVSTLRAAIAASTIVANRLLHHRA